MRWSQRIHVKCDACGMEAGARVEYGDGKVTADELRDFAKRVRELWPAGAPVHLALATVARLTEERDALLASLVDVFHDVEWLDSGDYGPDSTLPTLKHYPNEPPRCDVCNAVALDVGPWPHSWFDRTPGQVGQKPCTGSARHA